MFDYTLTPIPVFDYGIHARIIIQINRHPFVLLTMTKPAAMKKP